MDCINKDRNSEQNFHFIAIGGVGMSGLAKYLLEKGFSVSGSDANESKYFLQVKKMGAKVFVGHDENNLPANSIVIASTAIKENNPELRKAKANNMQILHRSDLLKFIAEKFQEEKGKFIGFSGTHGKTTTSGLASFVLEKAGEKPSYVVGGIIPQIDTNAKSADGKYFTAELDESDGTILKYSPDVIVINNLETDHVDFYKNGMESLLETFSTFLSTLKPDAKVLINIDCKGNQELIRRNPNTKFITYGLKNADYSAQNIVINTHSTSFSLIEGTKELCKIDLSILGQHNIYNALAVAAAINEAGCDIQKVAPYFVDFTGMGRRYEFVANVDGIEIIDDYAHHPSEISATLACAKESNPNKRIVAIFQPHRYTRLHGLFDDFLKCFNDADKVIVLDTYAASEEPINGHTSEEFANILEQTFGKDGVVYIGGKIADITQKVSDELHKNDVAITLGAGDITKLGKAIAELHTQKTSC